MRQPKPHEWAYLAALIDGEGCILKVVSKRQPKPQPRVIVVMSTEEPIKWVHEHFGGKYRFAWAKIGTKKRERRYYWGCYSSADCARVLTGVLPYMRLKMYKAEEVRSLALVKLKDEDVSEVS